MRFVLYGTYIPAAQLTAVARWAEALGFAAISVPDHVVYPHETATPYPYEGDPETGLAPWDPDCEWPDPFVSATAILGATQRLQVITGVCVLAMRDPLVVAKSIATIDALFPGRFALGVGAGWLREEYEILGQDFDTRGPRTDEAIGLLRALCRGERVAHDGRFFQVPPVTMRPAAPTGVRILIGGDAPAALRRAGRLADGMIPPLNSWPRAAEHLESLARIRAEAGRADEPFEYIGAASRARTPQALGAMAELGIDTVHVDPFALYVRRYGGLSLDERRAAMERYARELMAPVTG
jgi:probable F420-dependent oxidoreductase